jgi:glycosyltransferase involved in cell wall biosynthesis
MIRRGTAALGSRFFFQGFVNQSQLGQYFLPADALVLPSTYEAWGLVVNEAMQFGLPVITSDHVNCHADLVIPGQTGFVFPAGNKIALAKAMQQLLDDRWKTIRMGENSRRHIQRYVTEASVRGIVEALGFERAA